MIMNKPVGIRLAAVELLGSLNYTLQQVANLVGVTEATLQSWTTDHSNDKEISDKVLRLLNLNAIVTRLKTKHGVENPTELLSILHNGRVIFDPTDEEDGSISLLGFACAYTDAQDWATRTDEALVDFRELERRTMEPFLRGYFISPTEKTYYYTETPEGLLITKPLYDQVKE